MANMTPSTKAQTWKRHILDWQRSGQSIAAFCKARNLKENRFHYWRPQVAILPVPAPKSDAPAAAAKTFVPVQVALPRPKAAALTEIELASGLVLRLPGDVPVSRLVELAQALQAAGC